MILQWNADHIFDQDPPVSQGDFPGGSDGKTSVYSVGDLGSIPGLGRSPGEGNGNQLQYYCLENPMDRGGWWLQSMGVQRVDMTEQLSSLLPKFLFIFLSHMSCL